MAAVEAGLRVVGGTSIGSEFDDVLAIEKTLTPQVVIALCGPLGTPLHEVAKSFEELLLSTDYGYEHVEIIRLSDEIRSHKNVGPGSSTQELIEAGNELRRDHGNEVLAKLAVRRISVARAAEQAKATAAKKSEHPDLFKDDADDVLVPNVTLKWCHIIDSVKHVDELRLLRSIYGEMLYVVGVYSPIEMRIARLESESKNEHIHDLIDRDSGEEIDHGQRVEDTFPQSDFFLRVEKTTDSHRISRVRRFLDLMLGTVIATPTINERAMYAAFSAARNSACLSRQVGAAITSVDGELISTGWNDVPKAFGGLYQTEGDGLSSDEDRRCWNMGGGVCSNDQEKKAISTYIVDKLIESDIIPPDKKDAALLVIRNKTQLKSLIEFSRAVHAEMHALLNAGATDGAKIRNGKLFVTTYPCHSCARHLVAAGIKEVIFLEPYRKSLATRLHQDAITENESDTSKVRVLPFDGVAPSRFLRFFSAHPAGRKKDGRMILRDAEPVARISMEAVSTLEGLVVKGLESCRL
ncbi:anti-phage dCTP deaminase [Pseudomonas frederiksbergensis]|uniref:Cytidine deaminase n=1 Tax=Pseudomonas frederiksbergensis TaxID=104087 RepID=A0A423K550_9PSED|nr:anti-phage dCTP deaminase [Pseudomonas frederiksbergensis]RON46587.1 cytidine deaminase [Pseudomonas frederiksbergensis]